MILNINQERHLLGYYPIALMPFCRSVSRRRRTYGSGLEPYWDFTRVRSYEGPRRPKKGLAQKPKPTNHTS
eukprot:scaffold3667_cov180-Amphora_coffeaeformis.AAC.1